MYEYQSRKKAHLAQPRSSAPIQRITFSPTAYDPNDNAAAFTQQEETTIRNEYGSATQKLTNLNNDANYGAYTFLNEMLVRTFNDATQIYPMGTGDKAASAPLGPNEISIDAAQHVSPNDYRISLYHEGFHIACGGRTGRNETYYGVNPSPQAWAGIRRHVTNGNNHAITQINVNGVQRNNYSLLNPDSVAFWIDSQP